MSGRSSRSCNAHRPSTSRIACTESTCLGQLSKPSGFQKGPSNGFTVLSTEPLARVLSQAVTAAA
jgi:hypothetical protein